VSDPIPPGVVATCTIFIPAYQAAGTLEAVIERIPDSLWASLCAVHVINDGSTDDTNAVVRRIAERHPKVVLHSEAENRGYGAAVRRGLRLALEDAAEYVICLHADGQYPPEKLPEFLPYMEEHGVENKTFGLEMSDYHSGADEESHLNPIGYGLRCLRVMVRYRLGAW